MQWKGSRSVADVGQLNAKWALKYENSLYHPVGKRPCVCVWMKEFGRRGCTEMGVILEDIANREGIKCIPDKNNLHHNRKRIKISIK